MRDAVDGDEKGPGVLDGSARILREILRSSRIVQSARIVLADLDPTEAPELVRAALFGDTALFLDLLSASPKLANTAIEAAREVAARVLGLPERLVDRFVPRLVRELDGEALGEGAALTVLALARMAGRDQRELADALAAFEEGVGRGFSRALQERDAGGLLSGGIGRAVALADRAAGRLEGALGDEAPLTGAVEQLAGGIRRLARDHPRLMDELVRPLATAARDALEGSR